MDGAISCPRGRTVTVAASINEKLLVLIIFVHCDY